MKVTIRWLLLTGLLFFPPWITPRQVLAKGGDDLYPRSFVLAYLPDGADLQQVNPDTLADMPGLGIWLGGMTPNTQIMVNPDGKSLALVTYGNSDGVYRSKDVSVQVRDSQTGAELATFHPQRPMSLEGFTPDGQHLYGYQPVGQHGQILYVISARSGRVTAQLGPAKSQGSPLFDLAHHRIYMLRAFPLDATTHQPRAPEVIAYDLPSAQRVSTLLLPGVKAGFGPTGDTVQSVTVFGQWSPGAALSPDGATIAILDGTTDSLQLVDTQRMVVTRVEKLGAPQTLWQRLGMFLGLIPEAAYAKEIEGVWLSLQYSPDGRSLYMTGTRSSVDTSGMSNFLSLGVQRIDVTSGTVTASNFAGQQIWWSQLAPDGSAFYVLTPAQTAGGQYACPCTLHRLDAQTLHDTASRSFPADPSGGSPAFYILAAPSAPR